MAGPFKSLLPGLFLVPEFIKKIKYFQLILGLQTNFKYLNKNLNIEKIPIFNALDDIR